MQDMLCCSSIATKVQVVLPHGRHDVQRHPRLAHASLRSLRSLSTAVEIRGIEAAMLAIHD